MAAQYDYQPGLDISGRPNIELYELIQAIFGIAPLANIGGVIYGTATPDVTNNPRFARYLWLDSNTTPPTPKYYNTGTLTWAANSVADGAITAAKIADAAVTILDAAGNSDRIARSYTAAVDATKANYILRLDANGQYVEIAAFASLFTAGVVPLTALNKAGAVDLQVLQYAASDGLISLRTLSASAFADGSIGLAKLAIATVGYVTQMVGTAWTAVAPKSLFSGADENNSAYLTLFGTGAYAPKDSSGGASAAALQVPQRNAANTATLWSTPKFSKEMAEVTAAATLADGAFPHAHGLGVLPKNVEAVLVCSTTEAGTGYTAGDEVDCPIVNPVADVAGAPFISVARDTNNLTVLINNSANAQVRHKTTGVYTTLTSVTNWKYRIRAWA